MPDPYISEVKYLGGGSIDFIEVAVNAGTDVSDVYVTVYHPDGTVRTVNELGSLVATEHGKDIYVIEAATSATFNGIHKLGAMALEHGGTLLSFQSFDDGPPVVASGGIADGLTSTQIGMAGSGSSLETTDGGTSYTTRTSPTSGSVPCLCGGTLVSTVRGEVPVEQLRTGDLVRSVDGGFLELRRVFRRRVAAVDLVKNPKLRPVVIREGAFGQGLPNRDLKVSRQHRFLVESRIAQRMTGERRVLVSAIHLTPLEGVEIDVEIKPVEYFHLMFDRHAVVFAEGAPTESFLAGDEAVSSLQPRDRMDLAALFAGDRSGPGTPCYLIPKKSQQQKLAQRHAKNAKPLVSKGFVFGAGSAGSVHTSFAVNLR